MIRAALELGPHTVHSDRLNIYTTGVGFMPSVGSDRVTNGKPSSNAQRPWSLRISMIGTGEASCPVASGELKTSAAK